MDAAHPVDPHQVPLSLRGPAPVNVVVAYGFWLFLLSDIVIFSGFFAAFAVLSNATAGGPSGAELFDRGHVLAETALLLLSSFTCGLFSLAAARTDYRSVYLWAGVTVLLGAGFLALEVTEFAGMVAAGNGPSRSAFLSAFFALVGAHGLHVTSGILWFLVMLAQVGTLGLIPMVRRRLLCLSLFWHALDIVWVGVFTIVYLGAGR